MKARHRLHAPGLLRRILPAAAVLGLAIVVSAPAGALALFFAAPSAQTAGVTAATISAATGFQTTASGSTTVNLSWTAPPALTGYTLAQSPGTLAGCSATPSASTTSCTATGLSPSTTYTWTLTADYNNWQSSSAQVSTTSFATVGATLHGSATDNTSASKSSTVTPVTTTNGAALLILVYRRGSSGNLAIDSISGTAISGTPAPSQVNAQSFNGSGGTKYEVLAWQAAGTGVSGGAVTVNFAAANNLTTTIDVVQLSGYNTASPIARSAVNPGSSSPATGAALTGASASDGEVFFAGLSGSATTMSTPNGYTALDAPATALHGSWFSSSASSSGVTTTLGASAAWGTIEVEINHG
jgi:hypothetical protein